MDRRRRAAIGLGAALAAAGVLPSTVNATVKHDPVSEVALNEMLWMPRSVRGVVCLRTPGRQMGGSFVPTVTRVSRLQQRGVRLEEASGTCEGPVLLRVEAQERVAGCAGRVLAEWWFAPGGRWTPAVRLRRQVYESASASRTTKYIAVTETRLAPCTRPD
jgi:hypothetical protein